MTVRSSVAGLACLLATVGGACGGSNGADSGAAVLVKRSPSGEVILPGETAGGPAGTPADGPAAPSTSSPEPTAQGARKTVDATALTGTVVALCVAHQQSPRDPAAARQTYTGSRPGIEATVQALRPAYSGQAASVAAAMADVDTVVAAEPVPPTLGLNLGVLAETMRQALALLGVRTSPCKV